MGPPSYSAYKDSGVDWIGSLPISWNLAPLKRHFQIIGGSTPKSGVEAYWNGTIPWATPSDLSRVRSRTIADTKRTISEEGLQSCGATLVPAGSIILSTRAPIGSLAIAERELCTNQGCKSLVPTHGISSTFAAYVLEICKEALNVRGKGTTFLELAADELAQFAIPLTSEVEQEKIATFLDAETAKIDILVAQQRRLIELLKEKRQAVISHAVTKSLNPNAPMKPSGNEWLGDVPEHWTVAPVRKMLSSIKAGPFGSALTKDMYSQAGFRVYGQEQVIPGDFSIGNYYIPQELFNELEQYAVKPGDVLVSCVGTFGKIAVVPDTIVPGIINPRLMRLRCSRDVLPTFLLEVLRSIVVFEQLDMLSRGGTMDVINIGTLSRVVMPVPPIDEQLELINAINQSNAQVDELIFAAQQAISLLQERRTALISAAVTGKIDVRNYQPDQAA